MQPLLDYKLIEAVPPLDAPSPDDEPPFVPQALEKYLFEQSNIEEQSPHIYAIVDAAKVQFLPDRLTQTGLEHVCLYSGEALEEYGETAPWLVKLSPDANFTRNLFSFSAEKENPWHMLALDVGIILRSTADIEQLRSHLRRYTQLSDEYGVREFFRFQEPGFLDAILQASSKEEVAYFFKHIDDYLYMVPSLTEDHWDAVKVTPSAHLEAIDPDAAPVIPTVDASRRNSLQYAVNAKRARHLARSQNISLSRKSANEKVYSRLMNAGFDNETGLVNTAELLAHVPSAVHPEFWEEVESGDYSLRFLLIKLAKQYQLEAILK